MKAEEKLYYTQEETAQLLGLSRSTVVRKMKSGEIPTVNILGIKKIPCKPVDEIRNNIKIN